MTVIAGLSLLVWVWLLLGQGFFWRTDVRLPRHTAEPAAWPAVAVVVPARDEAAVLGLSLPSLLAQRYPGRAEVFLVDDGSTDGTGETARGLAAGHGGLPLTVSSPASRRRAGRASCGPYATVSRSHASAPGRSSCCSPTRTSHTGRRACARWSRRRSARTSTWCRRWPGCGSRPGGSG